MNSAFPHDRVTVVLVRSRNPLNIGAAARAMANFGFSGLRVVQPYDRAWRRARSAVGASQILASARNCSTLAEAVADCTVVLGTASIGYRHPSLPVIPLPSVGREVASMAPGGRLAIVFGSENHGLGNDDFSLCSALLNIPTSDVQESMNLGQAVAVCLYELVRNPSSAPLPLSEMLLPGHSPATSADRERLTQSLHRILGKCGYIKPGAGHSILVQIRPMLDRLRLSGKDAHWILGMLSRIDRRLVPGPPGRRR